MWVEIRVREKMGEKMHDTSPDIGIIWIAPT